MTVRVVVVDDQVLVRIGLSAIISAQEDLEVVGEAVDGADAVSVVRNKRPDVVLMDIRMPRLDGIEATRQIVGGLSPAPAVLILTTFDLDEHVFAALRVGAAGFLVKDTRPEDLLGAIRVLATGDSLLGPSVTRRLIAEFIKKPSPSQATTVSLEQVTPRERDVLTLVGRGLSNQEIAAELFLSVATVKSHLGRATTKLDLASRAQAVVFAYDSGLATTRAPDDGQ